MFLFLFNLQTITAYENLEAMPVASANPDVTVSYLVASTFADPQVRDVQALNLSALPSRWKQLPTYA